MSTLAQICLLRFKNFSLRNAKPDSYRITTEDYLSVVQEALGLRITHYYGTHLHVMAPSNFSEQCADSWLKELLGADYREKQNAYQTSAVSKRSDTDGVS